MANEKRETDSFYNGAGNKDAYPRRLRANEKGAVSKHLKPVWCKEKHLRLEVLGSITVDCRSGEIDPMSAAFLQMASIFSELEKNILRSRVRSGMVNAKAKGKQIGRRPTTKADFPAVFIKYYPAYADGIMSITELTRICGISRPTAYKYIKMMTE